MDIVELLKNLVEIKSVNDPVRGEKPSIECPRFIRDTLVDMGLYAEIIESNGFYTVYGCIGRGRPIILFMAHFDTVPTVPEEWRYDPFKFTIVNGKGFGRGAADDKSNVAAMIIALKELKNSVKDFTLVYAFTGDEEIGGYNGAKMLKDKLLSEDLKPDFVINGDGKDLDVIVRRRSAFKVQLKIKSIPKRIRGLRFTKKFTLKTPIMETYHAAYFIPGVDMHPLIAASHYLRVNKLYTSSVRGGFVKSNVLPSWVEVAYVKEDPNGEEVEVDLGLTKLIDIVLPLTRCNIRTELPSDYGVTITPNQYFYEGGEHTLYLDIRAMTDKIEHVKNALEKLIKCLGVEASITVKGGSGYLYTPEDSTLVKCALKVLESLGLKPRVVEMAGASDSRYFSPLDIQCIDIGPVGGNIHGPNEYVELWSLVKLVEFYNRIPRVLSKHK